LYKITVGADVTFVSVEVKVQELIHT